MRIVKWKFTKSPFPWLQNWMFRYTEAYNLSKGVIFEPEFYASEMGSFEEDAYIGPGCLVSSHVVEGVWGRIILLPVHMGKHACACGKNIVGCGTEMDDNAVLLPGGALAKAFHLRANQFYDGVPAVRISPKKLQAEYFGTIQLPEIPPKILAERMRNLKSNLSPRKFDENPLKSDEGE
jgi:hypothetical protein